MIPKRWFIGLAIVIYLVWLVGCRSSSSGTLFPSTPSTRVSLPVTPTTFQPPSTKSIESPTPTAAGTSSALSGELAEPIDTGAIQGAPLFSPDGASLAVPTSRGVGFYDAQTLTALGLLAVDTGTEYLAFSPDGARLASGGGWHVQLWQNEGTPAPEGWKLLRALTGSTSSPDSVLVDLGFSPDGQLLAAGFRSPANPPDGAILVWEAKDGEFHTSTLGMTFDFSPVQPRLAAVWQGSDESTIYSYSFTGAPTDIFRGEQAFFSPTGLLAAEHEGDWRLIDMQNGDTLLSLNGQALAFSPEGEHLALLERGKVRLYHLPDGTQVGVMDGSWDQALQLQFSPDGQSLAGTLSGCPTGEVCEHPMLVNAVWRLSDGMLILTLSGENYAPWITFSPDGKRLAASAPGGELALWRIVQPGE
jgi:WD40 repeat protein